MNKLLKSTFFLAVLFFLSAPLTAKENIGETPRNGVEQNTGFRNDCNPSISQRDLDINNVRARLLGGGDLWWDLSDGRYIIPNVAPGEKEISSIFAAAIWIGGIDGNDNLKMAAQTYRQGGNDFWPGPINASGETNRINCDNWDRHFVVLGENIDNHIKDFLDNGIMDNPISPDIANWPAKGNIDFSREYGYELPDQDLAPFFDVDGDGSYRPEDGDYPIIGVCGGGDYDEQAFADQMIWWVYNDKGNIHSETGGDQIGMEVQALAFSYKTNDEINNMSFYRYKLLNKATTALDSTYMGNWVDPDLGCWDNDFVGCDVDRALGIVYNGQATDPDCADPGGGLVNGYGNDVPMLGVDYFQGPSDETGEQLGMSAFVYYNNNGTVQGNPVTAQDFYNYLSGSWKDGLRIEWGGDGYSEGTFETAYMFPSDPSDNGPNAWSECSENNVEDDRRFVQSSGPFTLNPGATNEVIVGAVWIPKAEYPCPSFTKLQQADDKAQGLFDNCFVLVKGPDAPDLGIVEMDQEVIITISNKESSNNFLEGYSERGQTIPMGFDDSTYTFQGYRIYQTADADIGELEDPDLARQIATFDVKDGIVQMINYIGFESQGVSVLVPSEEEPPVSLDDSGIFRSLSIKNDAFTGERLINHKKYYFKAIAYAYNNYETVDPSNPAGGGQQLQYLSSSDNIKDYIAIPHINTPENDGMTVNSNYGDEPEITRVDGVGNSGNFLELTQESIDNIMASPMDNVGKITYASKGGPFTVKVVNPLIIKKGTYTLVLEDDNLDDTKLEDPINWVISDQSGNQWFSDRSIDFPNEQYLEDLGFSVQISNNPDPGVDLEGNNGFVGAELVYEDATKPEWFRGFRDDGLGRITNFLRTGDLEEEEARDPNEVYSNVLQGQWYPYPLLSWKREAIDNLDFLTPVWTNTRSQTVDGRNLMRDLNNVDIVFSDNPDDWSRCVVVNTYSDYLQNQAPIPSLAPFKARTDESIGKDGTTDNSGTTGMSWFPGYAIDLETGRRVNIFFGENPFYTDQTTPYTNASDLNLVTFNGKDMMWNPNSDVVTPSGTGPATSILEVPIGGQHFIYVTKEPYDGCALLRDQLDVTASDFDGIKAWTKVSWTCWPLLANGVSWKPMSEGFIPNDLTVKLRVDNSYDLYEATGENNSYPKYDFSFDGLDAVTQQPEVATSALDLIRVVPNPYYAFSAYERGQNETKVKITNLPANCVISIFSLDGKLIRRYDRQASLIGRDETRSNQIDTDLEWDLKNEKGIVISSGVYIIHIDSPNVGEKVVKWFGSMRQFDSLGL